MSTYRCHYPSIVSVKKKGEGWSDIRYDFILLFSAFLQDGQIRSGWPSLVLSCGSSEKVTGMRDFRDSGCVFSGSDAGHTGDIFFSVEDSSDCPVDGVNDGTQKFEAPLLDAAS
jgi:hypothetical protein